MSPTYRLRNVLIASIAALTVYMIANAAELLLIRRGTPLTIIVWVSDLIPATAFGLAAGLWLNLRVTRAALAERSRLMEAERDARAAAESASRAKDDFLATVAHELRTPLAAMTAAFQVLERAPRSEDRVRPRQVILLQAAHISRMVEDLLDIGRATTGKIGLRRTRIDLADASTRAVGTLRHAGKLGQHDVVIDAKPVWIDADPVRIEQIAVNLFLNAVKFTPPGGSIQITVMADRNDAVLRVRDTGTGIPSDLLPRVFGLFVQGEQTISPRDGLGIGLSLVRHLVELHGGTVKASSGGLGQGSTFEVRFPRAVQRAGSAVSPAVSEAAVAGSLN